MLVEIPHSADCAPGGVCDSAGKSDQRESNGFCVTGELKLPLEKQGGIFLADNFGDVLVPLFRLIANPRDRTA